MRGFEPQTFEAVQGPIGHLCAKHIRAGRVIDERDFGFGKVTEQLVVALLKDVIGTANNKAAPFLTKLKYMESGTGTTAETSYDYDLQTPAGAGLYSASITPTLAIVATSNNAAITWVGTINYTASYAITEWALKNAAAHGSQYNTSADAFTSQTITPTSSPSWTTDQWAGYVVIAGTSSGTANQSGAAYYGAFVESNSATALTIAQASGDLSYWTVNNNGGPGSTPATNSRFDIWPFVADHKTFAAINVNNGDSIQFTYTLTAQSGG